MLAYSDPGDLILDPTCAAGSVLVEAIRRGRRAIGLTRDLRQGALAVANISRAREQGAPGRAAVLDGNPGQLPRLLNKAPAILTPGRAGAPRQHPAGSARLIVTTPTAGELPALLPNLRATLTPGGFLLLALDQHDEMPVGLAGVVAAGEDAGLHYWQHVIALRTTPPAGPLLHTDVLAFRKPHPPQARSLDRQAVSA